jgi:hypothetical protein
MSRKPILHPVYINRGIINKSKGIVIYTTREEGKAFVHANCMFGHDAQRSGRCNSSEQKRPYSRVLYLILFDTRHNSLENESVTLYSKF